MAIRVTYQNPSVTNGIKVTIHDGVRNEEGKLTGKFKRGAVKFVKPKGRGAPGEDVVDYWLDAQGGRGAFVEELPT
jgi:hypothetical protein